MKKLMFGFATLALAVASAASTHKVTLFQDSTVNGKPLKAGEYRIELKDNKAILKGSSKNVVETDVKVETDAQKFSATTVRYLDGGKVQEIRIGGTNTKLVFTN